MRPLPRQLQVHAAQGRGRARGQIGVSPQSRMRDEPAARPFRRLGRGERPARRAAAPEDRRRDGGPAAPARGGQADRRRFASGKPHSMILWGPPGVGKTTLARLMANAFNAEFIAMSAVLAGVKEIREAVGARDAHARQSAGHHRVRGRGAPLQQGAAGCVPAARGVGPLHVHRRHHRKPVVRGESARCCRARRCTCWSPSARGPRPADRARLRDATSMRPRMRGARSRDIRRRRRAPRAEPGRAGGAGGRSRQARRRRGFREPGGAARRPALRQGRREVLRPDLGAAQERARQRPGCSLYWLVPHARRRRRSALPRAAHDPHGERGHRARRSARARSRASTRPSLRAPGHAGRRARARRMRDLPRRGAPKSNAVYIAYNEAQGVHPGGRHAPGAAAHPQRAHQAHEEPGLRQGLSLRARRGGGLRRRRELLPRRHGAARLVPADRTRPRGEDP